jgi:hypothetical protein
MVTQMTCYGYDGSGIGSKRRGRPLSKAGTGTTGDECRGRGRGRLARRGACSHSRLRTPAGSGEENGSAANGSGGDQGHANRGPRVDTNAREKKHPGRGTGKATPDLGTFRSEFRASLPNRIWQVAFAHTLPLTVQICYHVCYYYS